MIDFKNYELGKYKKQIDDYGFETTWNALLAHRLANPADSELLEVANFGELYEIGLAHIDKDKKKKLGKYFTPDDVSRLMATWLSELSGSNVCDVGCGSGNLILSYLDVIGEEAAIELIKGGNVYLYDVDELALRISAYSIGITYGLEYIRYINTYVGDFLDQDIMLPEDSKVISNPPYYKIDEFGDDWIMTDNIKKSKDFYSAIMEKVIKGSRSSVLITPYSFIGGGKFYPLRKFLNDYSGFIVSFDNVPGSIFSGKKHGIFNTNTANSVRAAITVSERVEDDRGYKVSSLVRFKNVERKRLLQGDVLEDVLPVNRQLVDDNNKTYYKVFKEHEGLFKLWRDSSNKTLGDIRVKEETEFKIIMPNSCRYYTVGAIKDLDRNGKHELYFSNEEDMNLVYALINSSFVYWYWRMYDGGITYPVGLLNSVPIFFEILSEEDKAEINKIVDELKSVEKDYLVYKKNAGKAQENIKFPTFYRDRLNDIFIRALGSDDYNLERVHKNRFF